MRQYLIGSWNNADSYDYSGEQLMGNRLGASREVPHFLANGRANVEKYGDNVAKPKTTSVPLVDRVLPQQRRVRVLTEQLYELEAERKNGMDIHTYSQLRDVLICKRLRAEELLKKAISVKPATQDDEYPEDSYQDTHQDSAVFYTPTYSNPSDNTRTGDDASVCWIDDLPATNSFRKPLKNICTIARSLVRWSQQAAAYYRTLKEV